MEEEEEEEEDEEEEEEAAIEASIEASILKSQNGKPLIVGSIASKEFSSCRVHAL
jgi:hypothetical protein